ncbi:MAG TPA: hypothetical protein VMT67_10815 [Terriglobales bacterium]|nr:hypothetical protein [Terriglobales bacterium]
MKFGRKAACAVLGAWFIFFSVGAAFAQTTSASGVVFADLSGTQSGVCTNAQQGAGPIKAKCGGDWIVLGAGGGGTFAGASKYGMLTSKTNLSTTVFSETQLTAGGVQTESAVTSAFSDVLGFPNLPDGTSAVLTATISLTGNATGLANVMAEVSLGGQLSNCQVQAIGTCTATVSFTGGTGPLNLSSEIVVNSSASVAAGVIGSSSASNKYVAKITALNVTLASGAKCRGDECAIVTASGHKYPK